jgi:hypothetical protein
MSDRSEGPSPAGLRLQLKRPPILVLFGWFLIATGALAPYALIRIEELPHLFPLAQSRFPPAVHHLVIAANGALRVACGVGLLSGSEWARLGWVLVSFALVGFDMFAFPPSARILVPSALLPALSLYVLFRPSVNDYFVALSRQNFPDAR